MIAEGCAPEGETETLGKTLDVGCGENKQGDVGCDLRRLDGVDVICDVLHLPFRDKCFAKVRSSVVIEHTVSPFSFLAEQIRVLAHDGTLICEADNARYWRYHVDFTKFEQDFVTHFRSPTYNASDEHFMIFYPECVVKMLLRLDLRNFQVRHVGPTKKLDRIITSFFPRLYKNMCSRFIITCENGTRRHLIE